MKLKAVVFFSILFSCFGLHAGSLRLLNDTKYEMKVHIKGSDGSELGEVTVPPNSTVNWSDTYGQSGFSGGSSFEMNKSNKSKTPYAVHWITAKNEEEYSACYDVHTGTTVSANACRKGKR